MWPLSDMRAARATIAWTSPLRLLKPLQPQQPAVQQREPAALEFDEDGRVWVFRYSRAAPQARRIDRDRIFEYMKRHRLPNLVARQIRRDARNAVDFFTSVRELQTHPDASPIEPES